ncbi:Glycosyl transferases group 1 [Microbacterium sp. cf046]|uniref:glycosyltransferase family 4 protein n=1 Tax=Microbacterium sp. cf046 TaxID=1761803 RepID=UPI0008E19483|nr:glycosyltransferase family 4 protein [Microbacterium sp. cf046]SFS14673.1 Glycosyl transferases group 1 [Microbacterium sp. cf046]
MTASEGRTVHFVVPEGIDDPTRASGGNVFDRRVRDGLASLGWTVRMRPVGADAPIRAADLLASVPEDEVVLIDGLIAGRAPDAIEDAVGRLQIVTLAHMVSAAFPGADPRVVAGETRALRSTRRVITTSEWTRSELERRGTVAPGRIVVARPGSDDAPAAGGTSGGGAFLCVGVVAPHKGQDILIEALAGLRDEHTWTCTVAGSLDADPRFADRLAALAAAAGIDDRITMTGVLGQDELDDAYDRADLVVAPSRVESYGMAIADALRRGIPVLASAVGGIPQTVESHAATLVPPGRPDALTDALRRWLADPALRADSKDAAGRGRSRLPRWSDTADRVAATLASVR